MLAARLRHRVAIQEPVETQNATTGAVTVTWQNVALDSNTELDSVPAEVLTGPGKEFFQSGAEQSSTTARINIRWFAGLTQKMRIVWDGKTYNILSFETDVSGRREYRIICGDEGVNTG